MWLRRWFWVGGGISLLGGLLWLLVEHDLGLHALVRSAGWAIVVWVGCGRWLRPAVAGQALIRPRGAPRRSSRDASSRSRRAAPGCPRPAPCVGIGSRLRRRYPRARASCRTSRETRARSIPDRRDQQDR